MNLNTQTITLRSGSRAASLREQAVPTIRSQALKLEATSLPSLSQRLKLQARVHKLQDLRTRVQAHKPTVRGASNEDKGIFFVFHVKGYLVR
tara:strand:- start:233 stop:508 length:276 start_codon:yes stop_codon:yes gene_type:complete